MCGLISLGNDNHVYNNLKEIFVYVYFGTIVNNQPNKATYQQQPLLFLTKDGWFVFVLRFYGPVNPMVSCWAQSVYLTTLLLGRLSPLSS